MQEDKKTLKHYFQENKRGVRKQIGNSVKQRGVFHANHEANQRRGEKRDK